MEIQWGRVWKIQNVFFNNLVQNVDTGKQLCSRKGTFRMIANEGKLKKRKSKANTQQNKITGYFKSTEIKIGQDEFGGEKLVVWGGREENWASQGVGNSTSSNSQTQFQLKTNSFAAGIRTP